MKKNTMAGGKIKGGLGRRRLSGFSKQAAVFFETPNGIRDNPWREVAAPCSWESGKAKVLCLVLYFGWRSEGAAVGRRGRPGRG
jgi:hypothetical protein